jgi:hypothetical protein
MPPTEATVAADARGAAPAGLDDVMLAMDVVDTLRHRERLVERELDEDLREEQLVDRLRALYKSQGIEVPDNIIAQGVKALKESRFVYTPLPPSFRRSLATLWVKRSSYGKWAVGVLAALAVAVGLYQYAVVGPRNRAAEAARIELSDALPRQLTAAHQAAAAEARVPEARERSDAIFARGRAALERGDAANARAAVAELDRLLALLRQEYALRIAGRPQDQTGFWREHPSFQGRAYFIVVDAVDPESKPVKLSIRNDETNQVETVSRFAVRVPIETYDAVRDDKASNGIVQNARMAEKRQGFLEPEFRMAVLEGRLTQW